MSSGNPSPKPTSTRYGYAYLVAGLLSGLAIFVIGSRLLMRDDSLVTGGRQADPLAWCILLLLAGLAVAAALVGLMLLRSPGPSKPASESAPEKEALDFVEKLVRGAAILKRAGEQLGDPQPAALAILEKGKRKLAQDSISAARTLAEELCEALRNKPADQISDDVARAAGALRSLPSALSLDADTIAEVRKEWRKVATGRADGASVKAIKRHLERAYEQIGQAMKIAEAIKVIEGDDAGHA